MNWLKNKATFLSILFVVICACIFLGLSYAFWIKTETQNDFDVLGTKCFELTMVNESNNILIENAHPRIIRK